MLTINYNGKKSQDDDLHDVPKGPKLKSFKVKLEIRGEKEYIREAQSACFYICGTPWEGRGGGVCQRGEERAKRREGRRGGGRARHDHDQEVLSPCPCPPSPLTPTVMSTLLLCVDTEN